MTDDDMLDAMYSDLASIAERCGIDVARAMVDQYGGQKIWIPRSWHDGPRRPLQELGESAARSICDAFGGVYFEVPLRLFTPAGLRRMIRCMTDSGASRPEIARALRCSYRTIRDELSGAGPRVRPRLRDIRQIEMFPESGDI